MLEFSVAVSSSARNVNVTFAIREMARRSSFAITTGRSNLSRRGLKLNAKRKKKKKGGRKNTQRAVDLLGGRVFTTILETKKEEGGILDGILTFFPPLAVWGDAKERGGRGGRRFEKFESTRNQKAEPHYKLKWNFQLPLDGYMVFYA